MRFDNPKELWTDSTGTALRRPDRSNAVINPRAAAGNRLIQRGSPVLSWGSVTSTSHSNGGAINADTQFGGTHTAYVPYNASRARVSVGLAGALDLSGFKSFGVWITLTASAPRVLRGYMAREAGFTNSASWDIYVTPGTAFYVLAKGSGSASLPWVKNGAFDFSDALYFRVADTANSIESGFTNTGLQAGESYTISHFTAQPRARACLLIQTDDGYAANVRNGDLSRSGYPASGNTYVEIASHYGIRCTAYVIPELIGSSATYMTQDDMRVLLDAGWVLGTHSNAGSGGGLTNLADQTAIYAEITTEMSRMAAFGFVPDWHIRHFALPQGGYDYRVAAALDQIPELVTVRAIGGRNGAAAAANTIPVGHHVSCNGNIVWRDTGNALFIKSSQQLDGPLTTTDHDNYLASLVAEGAVGSCYTHSMTGAIATSFDYFCAAAATLRTAGKLDIMTVDEFYRSMAAQNY